MVEESRIAAVAGIAVVDIAGAGIAGAGIAVEHIEEEGQMSGIRLEVQFVVAPLVAVGP